MKAEISLEVAQKSSIEFALQKGVDLITNIFAAYQDIWQRRHVFYIKSTDIRFENVDVNFSILSIRSAIYRMKSYLFL